MSDKSSDQKDPEKQTEPDPKKVEDRRREQSEKTFQQRGTEVRK